MPSTEKFYFYSYYTFLGRLSFAKCRNEPIIKSVNGGGKQRIKDKIEITEEQFNNVDIVTLTATYFPKDMPNVKH